MNDLAEAHAEINALGGADRPGNEYDQGYGAALDDALAAIERLQAKQRATDRARAEIRGAPAALSVTPRGASVKVFRPARDRAELASEAGAKG